MARHVAEAIERQRGHLFPWVPVFLAIGIGAWFALPWEPGRGDYLAIGAAMVAALVAAALIWHHPVPSGPLALALALVLAGALLAGLRAHAVAAPVLGWRYYGPVEGRIVEIDRSGSDKVRLTLDRVTLEDVSPTRTPARVRLSLHGDGPDAPLAPGARVMTTGHLAPPGGPVEPGGFDFRRLAWFEGIGAVGYTRVPVLLAAPMEGSAALPVARARRAIFEAVTAAMPGDRGAFAAAVTTGDRSAMDQDTVEALRASNLAHLLAISGLHMGLLTGFVFAAVRGGLALAPPLALRLPVRAVAAVIALAAATAYLALSGGAVATERAYVMAVVVLGAVLLGRRALTLRAVALAATVVLVLRPEQLTGPGFQMSFAATAALVATFAALRRPPDQPPRLPRWLRPAAAVVISSTVAGLATAPFGAAHFNQVSHYGLLANLAAVPVMGTVVMPAAVVAALLAPLGLAQIALEAMGLGIAWILWVARAVAALEGATSPVAAPPALMLPLLALGGATVVIWQGRGRWAGLVPMLAAAALWAGAERPAVLISEDGALVGAMVPEGRALSRARGAGFTASLWLENDGDEADQAQAATRMGGEGWTSVRLPDGAMLYHLPGTKGPAAAAELCKPGNWLVLTEAFERDECMVLDAEALRAHGAVAIRAGEGGALSVTTARGRIGQRLWNGARPVPPPPGGAPRAMPGAAIAAPAEEGAAVLPAPGAKAWLAARAILRGGQAPPAAQ